MSSNPQPDWENWFPPLLFFLCLLICGGAFIRLIGAVIQFVTPFLS